ncbi:Fic family protein, partial [Vibrio cholerae]
ATTPQGAPQVTPQVKQLLEVLEGEMLREEIQAILGLKDRKSFRDRYLKPALEAGLIEMTLPDKPTSKVQRYRKRGV